MSAAGRQHDLALAHAHLGRIDDLVGVTLLQHAVLVDARGMGEGVGAHDGLVGLHVHAGDGADQAARLDELAGVDVGVRIELLAVHAHGHDHFLHGRVACALAEAVDGALDLCGPVAHAGQRQRRGHAQVVVAVHRHGDIVDAGHVVHEVLDARAEVLRQRVARGVRDVHHRGPRLDDRLDDPREEREIRPARVLGVELHVFHVLLGVADRHGTGSFDALVLGDAQLVAHVRGRHADAGVDAGTLRELQRIGRRVDVLVHGAGQRAHHGRVAGQLGDAAHRLEVAGA